MNTFETNILKSLLYDGEYFGKAMTVLEAKHFKEIGNTKTFELIKEHYNEYSSTPNLTEVVQSVKNVPNAEIRQEIINSLQKVSKVEDSKTEFMLDETVKFVKDALYLEALELGSEGLMKRDDTLKLKAEALMDERSKVQINTDLGLEFDDIQTMIDYYSERNIGLLTSSKEINKRLGSGFLPKTLSLFMAPASGGKSLLMTHLVSDWLKNNKNILLVSLEMGEEQMAGRVISNALDIPINSLTDLSKTDGELKNLDRPFTTREDLLNKHTAAKLSGTLGRLFIKEYATGSFSSNMLRALLDEYKTQKNLMFDVVLVDYLGIMKSDKVSPNVGLYSYIKSIGEELRAVAVERNIPIISASQLNRCLRTDTVVRTDCGTKKMIDIKVGDMVYTNDDSYNKVLNVSPITTQKMFKIRLSSGKEIICSGDHKFPTKYGTMTINTGLTTGIELNSKN